MKNRLSAILLLTAFALSAQSRAAEIDGLLVPPSGDHRTFRVTIAFFDVRYPTKPFSSSPKDVVNGSTTFRVPFTPPQGATQIKVTFTADLEGFETAEKILPLSDRMHACSVSWRPRNMTPDQAFNKSFQTTEKSVKQAETRHDESTKPASVRSDTEDLERVIALATTGNQRIGAANLKIRGLMARHHPKEAFQVYTETVKDDVFYQADQSKKLAFLAQWFHSLETAAEHRGAHVDRRTGLLFTSVPETAVGLRQEFDNLTHALARVDPNYKSKVSRIPNQATDQARLAAKERAVRECLARWLPSMSQPRR